MLIPRAERVPIGVRFVVAHHSGVDRLVFVMLREDSIDFAREILAAAGYREPAEKFRRSAHAQLTRGRP